MKQTRKAVGQDKVKYVMEEFKNGKLKDRSGKTVTDRNQALAIALSEAGISNKSLNKGQMLAMLRVYKGQLEEAIKKEISNDKGIRQEIIKYFKTTQQPKDTEVHAIAEKYGVDPSEAEQYIYTILSDLVGGGKSKGEVGPVDESELATGVEIESEHTKDKEIAEKIARDHLAEDPKYYTKLQAAGL
jgi:hypothetical protein